VAAADAPGERRAPVGSALTASRVPPPARRPTPAWPGRIAGPALPRRFYERPAPDVARALLGSILVSRLGRRLTAGRIVETEAYLGPEDGASHAAFRPGSRGLFYGPGGIAYVFRAYGLHACLNAIAGPRGTPGCVLIRALEPLAGLATMARRRGRRALGTGARPPRALAALTSGPARLTEALGITLRDNGADLRRGRLTIHGPRRPARVDAATGPRVGITRSPELPLRFWIRGNPYVSRGPAPRARPRGRGARRGPGRPGPGPEVRRPEPRHRAGGPRGVDSPPPALL
jgi:DNA-3-methyladenine glycosylase